ncbi:MAG: hypothetical protein R3202_01315 [Candidatus Competibacterales bacterium]|nr:hypothetical protein [Candidatus Competibacterales bacterium]
MANSKRNDERLRQLIAQECARIFTEEGVRDFRLAKRKASDRLGVSGRTSLPSNQEIEQAVLEYQRLFCQEEQAQLQDLRAIALEGMEFLEPFQPRLVGSVLKGIVVPRPEVELHVFAGTSEDVLIYLMDRTVTFETTERRLRVGADRHDCFPVVRFSRDGIIFDLTVFSDQNGREPPKSPVDGRPMQRAGIDEVRFMLAG